MPPPALIVKPDRQENQPDPTSSSASSLSSPPPVQTTTNSLSQPSPTDASVDEFVHHQLDAVPSFVLEYAPLVHLNSNEPFWPACLEAHLRHTVLRGTDGQPIALPPDHPCSILARPDLNHERTYLTAAADVRPAPRDFPWLVSVEGKPGPDRRSSVSPAILILVDKSQITGVEGTLDAFWFFFYSFNLGPTVANIHFGNHIADWEHCMMRFENGKPKAVHLSAHADGAAYTYECLEKMDGVRPVIFSALGSHAMYPKAGNHDYSPVKLIGPVDRTDRGPLWDPALHYAAFQHFPSPARDKFRAIDEEKDGKLVPCLQFRGQWGDEFSSATVGTSKKDNGWMASVNIVGPVKRTVTLDRLRWGDGVTGPRDKDLDRVGMNRYGNRIKTSI